MSYDTYDLFAATDNHLIRPKFLPHRSNHFYPSEASVIMHDKHGDMEVHGGCLRSSYFRITATVESTPHNARSMYIFGQGNDVESTLVKLWKEMGVWVDNSVRWYDAENNISGELDAILAEPPTGQLYGVEVKSFYGYNGEKQIFGNRSQKGFPKMGHLLQTLVYLNHFQDKLPYFRIAYFARDSVKRRTFLVELHKEDGKTYPKVEGEIIRSFTIEDMMERYKLLAQYVQDREIPPRDFELTYSDEKIRDFRTKNKVAKTKFEQWERGKRRSTGLLLKECIGDWQCSYCSFSHICYADKD